MFGVLQGKVGCLGCFRARQGVWGAQRQGMVFGVLQAMAGCLGCFRARWGASRQGRYWGASQRLQAKAGCFGGFTTSSLCTGMLLEMGGSQVRSLLQSPTRLAQAVDRAKAACLQHRQSPHHHSPDQSMVDGLGHNGANSAGEAACSAECMAGAVDRNGESLRGEWKQRYGECEVAEGGARCAEVVDNELTEEEVGELVYAEAVRLYPESAAKLTGNVHLPSAHAQKCTESQIISKLGTVTPATTANSSLIPCCGHCRSCLLYTSPSPRD